ncbi:dnaJ homolog subfamily C member 4 [Fundulus heteroclitus]|uniref:dnaJ homolog subfamily C member 4 n=1 Tax=Fundulus heteroclitus TaxID=8078 RepID=UPI00079F594B|nr:dnaJ homolog subfamily C member 4 [Fundulus heteroclitus]
MQLEAKLRLCQSCIWCCRSGLRMLSHSHAQRKAVSYYDLLGVKSDASVDEIKNAFFDKSKKLHPDSDLSNPALHSQFVELNEAYRVLSKELSRKEYDLRLQRPYQGDQAFRSTSSYTVHRSAAANDDVRYWEQFQHAQSPEATAEQRKEKRKRNYKLVIYCVITMMLSVGAHMVFFRKLEEVHSNFMDEKDRVITEIYNEAKERARVNGFKKQTELLRQKHAEFQEKLKLNKGGQDK